MLVRLFFTNTAHVISLSLSLSLFRLLLCAYSTSEIVDSLNLKKIQDTLRVFGTNAKNKQSDRIFRPR